MPGFTKEQIEEMFTYHPPTDEKEEKHKMIRKTFMGMAILIKDTVPDCPTQTVIIRELWNLQMMANGAIATDGKV